MHHRLTIICLPLLFFLGCSGQINPANLSYEGKWKRILEVTKDINAILEKVNDKASSDKAAPRLERLVTEYNALDAAIENSSADSMEQMTRIQKQYMQPLLAELMKVGGHAIRCNLDPDISATAEVLAKMEDQN